MEDLIRELARWRTIVGELEVQLNIDREVLDATWEAGYAGLQERHTVGNGEAD